MGIGAAPAGSHCIELLLGGAHPEHLQYSLHAARGSENQRASRGNFTYRWTEINYGIEEKSAYLVLGDAGVVKALVARLSHGTGGVHRT